MSCVHLRYKLPKDGEGATKLIEVTVDEMPDEITARMIAKTVVGSNLVKTAIYGEDLIGDAYSQQ